MASERLVAQGTFDRGLSRVDVSVLVEFLLGEERLLADVTLVRFDAQMAAHVQLYVLTSVEQPAADLALERVDSQVLREFVIVGEHLVARQAFVSRLCGHVVDAHLVFPQGFGVQQHAVADGTHRLQFNRQSFVGLDRGRRFLRDLDLRVFRLGRRLHFQFVGEHVVEIVFGF